mmetsp:Transcript_12151/g.26455  ORF Transcript_12151/g.26455 Transcript_12151/m.26455 type:complete len:124 (+) Transcript_12151:257-628(+)
MPAFTFIAVPSSIVLAGGRPVLVNITKDLYIDIQDLETQIKQSKARILMLSYMRGFMPNLDEVMELCKRMGVEVIEDCAHALGNSYKGRLLGTYGCMSNVSFQANKIIDAGEGGIVSTNDPHA